MEQALMRTEFTEQLEQLRLQVEVMAVRVDQNLERMRAFLETGDCEEAQRAFRADDDVDAMFVSLTEKCYELLALQTPVASDLRLVVSVLRVLSELERIGDLALRVLNVLANRDLVAHHTSVYDVLHAMCTEAIELYRTALRAWSSRDFALACTLVARDDEIDRYFEHLTAEIMRLEAPDGVQVAIEAITAGRALERIADHTVVIGARVRYLLTGDPIHLELEAR